MTDVGEVAHAAGGQRGAARCGPVEQLLVGETPCGGADREAVAEPGDDHLQEHEQRHVPSSRVSSIAPAMGPPPLATAATSTGRRR